MTRSTCSLHVELRDIWHHGCLWPRVTKGCRQIFFCPWVSQFLSLASVLSTFHLKKKRKQPAQRKSASSYLNTEIGDSKKARPRPRIQSEKLRGTVGPCWCLALAQVCEMALSGFSGILPHSPGHTPSCWRRQERPPLLDWWGHTGPGFSYLSA